MCSSPRAQDMGIGEGTAALFTSELAAGLSHATMEGANKSLSPAGAQLQQIFADTSSRLQEKSGGVRGALPIESSCLLRLQCHCGMGAPATSLPPHTASRLNVYIVHSCNYASQHVPSTYLPQLQWLPSCSPDLFSSCCCHWQCQRQRSVAACFGTNSLKDVSEGHYMRLQISSPSLN